MANSVDTKRAIRKQLRALENQRRAMKRESGRCLVRYNRFSARVASMDASIAKLEKDLNG
jgi:hypothetical protein